MTMLSPYVIENFHIDGYDVVVNKPKTAAYRAPGAPAATSSSNRANRKMPRSRPKSLACSRTAKWKA